MKKGLDKLLATARRIDQRRALWSSGGLAGLTALRYAPPLRAATHLLDAAGRNNQRGREDHYHGRRPF